MGTVRFRIEFWDHDRREWKRFYIDCPDTLRTPREFAECITEKLAEDYANSMYRSCVRSTGDIMGCRSLIQGWKDTYYRQLLPVIEEFIESTVVRRVIRERALRIAKVSPDVLALLQARTVAVAKYIDCLRRGRPCVIGLSSSHHLFFDADCRRFECLEDIIKVGIMMCRMYGVSSIVYPTRRGFHLMALTPVDKRTWRRFYFAVLSLIEEGKLKNIDPLHINMSLARGFSTLSVTGYRDVHYLIWAVRDPEGNVMGCSLFYSPAAIYRDRTIARFLIEFDEVRPLYQHDFYRDVRERWVEWLKGVA